MSPKKMIGLSFAAPAAKGYEVFEKPAGRAHVTRPVFAALRRCKPTVSQNDGGVMPFAAILMSETGGWSAPMGG